MSAPPVAAVRNERSGAVIGKRLRVADSPWRRLRGLLGHPEPAHGEGLLIEPGNGIHTVGMRYAIDVLFVRRDGIVLRCERALPPSRFVPWVRGAHRVLELPVGMIDATETAEGDRLTIMPGHPATDAPGGVAPLLDRTTLALAVLAGALLGAVTQAIPEGAATAVLAAPFVAAAAVDVMTRRIPNALTAATLALALVAAILAGRGGDAVLGSLAAFAAGLALHFGARGAFGLGDAKLMAGAGAVAGLAHVLDFLIAMALAGGVLALALLAVHRSRRATMPYGPAIAAGAVVALLLAR